MIGQLTSSEKYFAERAADHLTKLCGKAVVDPCLVLTWKDIEAISRLLVYLKLYNKKS